MNSSGGGNRARVFELIHLFEPISRAEIASKLDLTSATVSNIAADLLSQGYIQQLGRRTSGRGQPAIELGVQADAAYTIGLHFEHGCVAGIVADLKGSILDRRQVVLDPLPSPDIVLTTLIDTGNELINQVDRDKIIGVGLATVGPIDLVSGSVLSTEYTSGWGEVALRDPLTEAFALPVFMDNNATAGAIGEYWYGVGRSYSNFLYVGFYTLGLGGGLVLNKRIYRGSALNAAEFGHMIVRSPHSKSGEAGFLEHFVSGHALCRDFGVDITSNFEQRLADNDERLETWLDAASSVFAQALVSVDHLLDLDTIIIGGQLPHAFFSALVDRVQPQRQALYMHGWSRPSTLQFGRIGEDSAVMGAATLPIYDAFAPQVSAARTTQNSPRSVAAGGTMH